MITVRAAWDPDAMVWYTAYSDLPGLNLEGDTLDELRDKLAGAIEDLTGRKLPFELTELRAPF
jgi:predicted RNase H-like HicB family nuclease